LPHTLNMRMSVMCVRVFVCAWILLLLLRLIRVALRIVVIFVIFAAFVYVCLWLTN